MTTHTTSRSDSDIGRVLRHATAPELWKGRNGSMAGRAATLGTVVLWVLATIVLVSTGSWFGLAIGVVVYAASRLVQERFTENVPLLGFPVKALSWLVPLSLLIPQLLVLPEPVGVVTAGKWSIIACAVVLLFEFSPWMRRYVRHAQVSVGWSAAVDNRLKYTWLTGQEYEAMSSYGSRERWERYQPELKAQLAGLPEDWELFYGRNAADVIAVGPGGVVAVYSADFDGMFASSRDVVVDNDLVAAASVAVREAPGRPVFGSPAWYAFKQDRTLDIEAFNAQLLVDAYAQESGLVDGHGDDFGFYTPTLPSKTSSTLASRLGMSAQYSPVTVIVAHGLQMDTPWARVQVRDQAGWFGDAIVCHPRYVAECIKALPGVFGSRQHVADAQTAVDLRIR